jgi:hypothetical protein
MVKQSPNSVHIPEWEAVVGSRTIRVAAWSIEDARAALERISKRKLRGVRIKLATWRTGP